MKPRRSVGASVLSAGPDIEQEARAVAALSHPNILAIFDIGAGEHPYLVTELLFDVSPESRA